MRTFNPAAGVRLATRPLKPRPGGIRLFDHDGNDRATDAGKMKEYQNALDDMSNEAVEYVRAFQLSKPLDRQSSLSKKFKDSIDRYKVWVIAYTKQLRTPMIFYTAAINGVFATLIAGGLLFTQNGVTDRIPAGSDFSILSLRQLSLSR